jgi:hypothetical protein
MVAMSRMQIFICRISLVFHVTRIISVVPARLGHGSRAVEPPDFIPDREAANGTIKNYYHTVWRRKNRPTASISHAKGPPLSADCNAA